MRRAFLALSVVLCLFPVTAFAERPANYATVKLGAYFPQANDLEGFNNGFNGELAFGHYFNPNIAGEVGLGYFTTKADFVMVFPEVASITEKDKITVIPLTVTGKAVLPFSGQDGRTFPSELYIGAGGGAYFVKGKSDISAQLLPPFGTDSGSVSLSSNDVAFDAHIVVGGRFDVSPNIFAGVEMKYLWVKTSFSDTVFGVPITLDAKLDGITATANLGYRF